MKNKHVAYGFVLVMLSLVLVACAGFDLGDMVKVKTPNDVQKTQGLPRTVSLNEAEHEYQAWFEDVQRTGAQWRGSIERGGEIRGMLSQLSLSALNDIGPTLAGVPVVGPALPALTGMAGLFFGVGRLRREKEASFNKGMEKGRAPTPTQPVVINGSDP